VDLCVANKKTNPNWDDLRYFLAVVRGGTLSAAAETLDAEHTTVARHVHALEESLDARLFLKSNSGYRLTPAGERLQVLAESVETAFLTAKTVASTKNQPIAGNVRVGSPDGLGSVFLAPRLQSITSKHPRLSVELVATTRIFSLSKREADIAIGFSRTELARIVSRKLTDYRLCVYGSVDYVKKSPPIRNKADFVGHPFIGYVEEFVFFPELDYMKAVGEGIEPRLRSTNLMAQVFATLAGEGLCMLPTFIAAHFPKLVPVLPEKVSLTLTFHMHIHEDHRAAAHERAVADHIIAEVERNSDLFLAPPGTADKRHARLLSH
jgi:DNA-binding transcriptional LysR family regulator